MTDHGFLEERRRGLEEEFFSKWNATLLDRLRADEQQKQRRAALQACSGVSDPDVLDELIGLGIDSATLAALSLAPLVEVAWADGRLDQDEIEAVIASASALGLELGSIGYALLEDWLRRRPPSTLMDAWAHYVRALSPSVSHDALLALRADLAGKARTVAEATGGLFGVGSHVSPEEWAVLERVEAAFAT